MVNYLQLSWQQTSQQRTIGRCQSWDRYPKEEIQAFALGVVVLKRFSVKEVVTWGGQKETQRDLGSVVVVEDGFPKIIFEVAYVIFQLEMMATLFRGS